jgi:hypothetical protein
VYHARSRAVLNYMHWQWSPATNNVPNRCYPGSKIWTQKEGGRGKNVMQNYMQHHVQIHVQNHTENHVFSHVYKNAR